MAPPPGGNEQTANLIEEDQNTDRGLNSAQLSSLEEPLPELD